MQLLAEADCPDKIKFRKQATEILELMIDIKPKVIQDFSAISDTFPCNLEVLDTLGHFVSAHLIFGNSL